MALWLIWVLAASALIIVEVFTVSFYLLLAAIGALVAAFAAYLGFELAFQIFIASIVTLIGWTALHKFRPQVKHPDSRANPDLNMDIGASVRIKGIDANGDLIVSHRGANWAAQIENGEAANLSLDYQIIKIDGAKLILAPKITSI